MATTPAVLLSTLAKDTGPISKEINPWDTVKVAAAKSISRSLTKKWVYSNTDRSDSVALLKFLNSNYRCRNWTLHRNTSVDDCLWGELKRSLYNFWLPKGSALCSSDLLPFRNGTCGPGAAIGALDGSFYSKMYSSSLTCTSRDLYNSYKSSVSHVPHWNESELFRSSNRGDVEIVRGSRLTFVPKTDVESRSICVEPILNMFYQLGFGALLSSRLQSFYGIDIRDQQFRNRDLARQGSLTDCSVTIDLSSASDSLGLKLLKEILPSDFFNLLCRYRSPVTKIPGLGDYELDIISSMGNGFTFPLETVIFCAMIDASYRVNGFPKGCRDQSDWGCFGDDLIVPKGPIHRSLLRLLSLSGFLVNEDKSFFEGPFRESCGGDFFKGVDIRGVYFRSLSKPQDIYSALNRLMDFSARTGLILGNLSRFLFDLAPKNLVPMSSNDDTGLRVPLKIREIFFRTLMDRNGSYLYSSYEPTMRRVRFTEDRILLPSFLKRKGYLYNPPGAYSCFLQGSLESMSYSLRLKSVRYRKVARISPNWDTPLPARSEYERISQSRLGDVIYKNLFL